MKLYVARDKNGALYLYENKPYKDVGIWCPRGMSILLGRDALPEVKWEDEDPTEVELTIK